MMNKETRISTLLYRFTMFLFFPLMAIVVIASLAKPEWHQTLSDSLIAGFWMGLVAIAVYAIYVSRKK